MNIPINELIQVVSDPITGGITSIAGLERFEGMQNTPVTRALMSQSIEQARFREAIRHDQNRYYSQAATGAFTRFNRGDPRYLGGTPPFYRWEPLGTNARNR